MSTAVDGKPNFEVRGRLDARTLSEGHAGQRVGRRRRRGSRVVLDVKHVGDEPATAVVVRRGARRIGRDPQDPIDVSLGHIIAEVQVRIPIINVLCIHEVPVETVRLDRAGLDGVRRGVPRGIRRDHVKEAGKREVAPLAVFGHALHDDAAVPRDGQHAGRFVRDTPFCTWKLDIDHTVPVMVHAYAHGFAFRIDGRPHQDAAVHPFRGGIGPPQDVPVVVVLDAGLDAGRVVDGNGEVNRFPSARSARLEFCHVLDVVQLAEVLVVGSGTRGQVAG